VGELYRMGLEACASALFGARARWYLNVESDMKLNGKELSEATESVSVKVERTTTNGSPGAAIQEAANTLISWLLRITLDSHRAALYISDES